MRAGTGNPGNSGPATAAQLFNCSGVTVDALGNVLITERDAGRVRMVAE